MFTDQLLMDLRNAGIGYVEIQYDGYGDEGNIGEIRFTEIAGMAIVVNAHWERVVYDEAAEVLFELYGSWGDGEGSSGMIYIDTLGPMRIEHGWYERTLVDEPTKTLEVKRTLPI